MLEDLFDFHGLKLHSPIALLLSMLVFLKSIAMKLEDVNQAILPIQMVEILVPPTEALCHVNGISPFLLI